MCSDGFPCVAVRTTLHPFHNPPGHPRHSPPPQKLKCSSGVFISLDGGRIAPNGIVSGASFVVAPLERADHRFGSSGLLGEVS